MCSRRRTELSENELIDADGSCGLVWISGVFRASVQAALLYIAENQQSTSNARTDSPAPEKEKYNQSPPEGTLRHVAFLRPNRVCSRRRTELSKNELIDADGSCGLVWISHVFQASVQAALSYIAENQQSTLKTPTDSTAPAEGKNTQSPPEGILRHVLFLGPNRVCNRRRTELSENELIDAESSYRLARISGVFQASVQAILLYITENQQGTRRKQTDSTAPVKKV